MMFYCIISNHLSPYGSSLVIHLGWRDIQSLSMIIPFSWSHIERFHRYYQYLLFFFLSSFNNNDDRDFFFSLCKFFIICCPTCPLWISIFKRQIYRCQHSKLHFTGKVRFISFSLVFFWIIVLIWKRTYT